MADYFLQIDGIEGESLDAKHANWIDVDSWSWGENQPAQPATGGGAGAGKVAVPGLPLHDAREQGEPEAVPGLRERPALQGGAGSSGRKAGKGQQEFLTWTFSDVLVSGYETGAAEGADVPLDNVSLNFSKAAVSYRAQKADGSLDTAVTAGWDSKTNKKV